MKTLDKKSHSQLFSGVLLIFPALYFFTAAFLNYEMNIGSLWEPIGGYFDKPANKSIGWNANLVIAFGPVAAILLNLPGLIQLQVHRRKEAKWQLSVHIQLRNARWLLVLTGVLISCVMLAYAFVENCHCL